MNTDPVNRWESPGRECCSLILNPSEAMIIEMPLSKRIFILLFCGESAGKHLNPHRV